MQRKNLREVSNPSSLYYHVFSSFTELDIQRKKHWRKQGFIRPSLSLPGFPGSMVWRQVDNYVCMIYLIPLCGRMGEIQLVWKYLMNPATSGPCVCLAFSHFLKWTDPWLMNEQRIDHSEAIFLLKDGNLMGKCRSDWLIEQNNWAADEKRAGWRAV